jgi:succinyl-CoA synthetase alpha subunit
MAQVAKVIRNFYRDSVALMQLSARLSELPGVRQASAVMASANNLALLREAGLLAGDVAAGPNDLLVALDGEDETTLGAALEQAERALDSQPGSGAAAGPRREPPRSLEMGLESMPAANLALISTPGDYAAAEALKALHLGLNVMLFSDNVPIEDEVALKRYALAHELMVMGPDCGTAIIGGIPLGFANAVRRGSIGLVGASGTGLQLVTCLIDRLGGGVSQAIGTGGHDLSRDVGGITMLQGLAALADDAATKVIVLDLETASARNRRASARSGARGRQASGREFPRCRSGVNRRLWSHARQDAGRCGTRRSGSGRQAANRSPAASISVRHSTCRRWLRGSATCAASTAAAHCASRRRCCSARSLPDVYSNTPVGARASRWKTFGRVAPTR